MGYQHPRWPHEGLTCQSLDSPLLRGNITCSERDDDTDYTLLGLHILEENGPAFTPRDVAVQWLDHFPFHRVSTTLGNYADGIRYRFDFDDGYSRPMAPPRWSALAPR